MIRHNVAGLSYLTYSVSEPSLRLMNAVTTRGGGESPPPYDTLNLGLHVGDQPENVLENRSRAAQILGFEPEDLTFPAQVHGAGVARVGKADRGRGAVSGDDAFEGADALITNQPGLPLGILVADCLVVSMYDASKHAIGIAHAGWKGTLARVAQRTLEAMTEAFGSYPKDILVGLSPAIRACHYLVGNEVADEYSSEFGEHAAEFLLRDESGAWRLDLQKANAFQLAARGVPADSIETSDLCTACHPELFYSYRRDGGRTGRFGGFIMLYSSGRRLY